MIALGVTNFARVGRVSSTFFNETELNPFIELSELRLRLNECDDKFEVRCLLRFGTASHSHNGKEYEVGVSRAFLRLALEGCETTLGDSYGESTLSAVEEQSSAEKQSTLGGKASASIHGGGATGTAGMEAGGSTTQSVKRSQSKTLSPVVARPNNSWEIRSQGPSGSRTPIDGTALANDRLCLLERKTGGNRMSMIAELQVKKLEISVSARQGNRLNRAFLEHQNKDAIIAQLIKRALLRESSQNSSPANETVVISRFEVIEK